MQNLIKKKYINFFYPVLLGVITSFSLPPYNHFIINFFTLTLFLMFLINQKDVVKKKITYFKYGWLFGFGYFVSSLYWISIALTFDENFKILIPLALILVPSFLGIFYGIATFISSFFFKSNNISIILIFSIIFSFLEFVRGSIFTGFPWNLFVFSFSKNLEFIQILSILGTYGFNLFCITFFLTPLIFILRKSKIDIFVGFFFIFVAISFFIFGNIKIKNENLISSNEKKYLIKIISPKIEINRFYNDFNETEIIKDLIKLSKPEAHIPTIFVWPEGILTATNLKNINQHQKLFLKNFSEKHLIILGINDLIYENNEKKVYNSLVVVDKNLNIKYKYHKKDLVPFGEFLPFEKYLSKLGLRSITNQYQSFTSGHKRELIRIKEKNLNLNFLPLICYEIIYSGKLFERSNLKYDFIINISEDGWFGNSIGPNQHFSHSIFRAIEEGKNIIRSTNNGVSAVVSLNGKVLKRLESTQSGVIEISQFKTINQTIFSKYQNKMFFYLLLIYISFTFFIKKQGAKK